MDGFDRAELRLIRRKRRQRRRRAFLLIVLVLAAVGIYLAHLAHLARSPNGTVLAIGNGKTIVVPFDTSISPLRKRIVRLAESQIGYTTDPNNTYCNKFSAYWYSGTSNCGNTNLNEQWCADFAAWVWQKAGANVVYQYENGDLNSSSASFYEWGIAHGTWHPASSRYIPRPGDVAVYGLNEGALVADHVAVVIGYVPGDRGPIAINGDGDQTGFSVVEAQTDEFDADIHTGGARLSGYVSPS